MKKPAFFCCVLLGLVLTLCGCSVIRIEEDKRSPVEYTVVQPEELPKEAAEMIERKKAKEFQMTYQAGEDFYLIKGYGQQLTGGFSIRAEEVSQSGNAVFFKTKLIGPEEKNPGAEPSYPYIAVRIKYMEKPVQFI